MTSILSAFPFIGEQSFATPGAFNSPLSILSANIAAVNAGAGAISGVTISPPSGNTIQMPSDLSISGFLSVGKGASIGTVGPATPQPAALTINVNSGVSDYIHFNDTSNLRSDYLLGSHAGGTADGLNIYDVSGSTLIVSFSKQSVRFYQSVVGPVFDTGGALADTYNAATFFGSGSTLSAIQAAINQAGFDGISRVYVPASMYPYDASKISFIYSVQMVREGGNWAVYDVKAYGATGNESVDDFAALQGAISSIPVSSGTSIGGTVFFPPGGYRISSGLTSNTPGITLEGVGHSGDELGRNGASRVVMDNEVVGFTFNPTALSTHFRGPVIRNLQFAASASSASGGIRIRRANNFLLDNVCASGMTRVTSYGIFIDGTGNVSQYGTIYRCSAFSCANGITGYLCNGLRIHGCHIDGNANAGAFVVGSSGISLRQGGGGNIISDSNLQGCDSLITIFFDTNVSVMGCRFEVFGTAISLTSVQGGHLIGGSINNSLVGSTGTGVRLSTSSRVVTLINDIGAVNSAYSDTGVRNFRYVNEALSLPNGAQIQWEAADVLLQRIGSGNLQLTNNLYVQSNVVVDNSDGTNKILFGSGQDTNLYRGGPDLLKTDDSLSLPDGTLTAPALRFSSESSLGWVRSGTSQMALSYGSLTLPKMGAGIATLIVGATGGAFNYAMIDGLRIGGNDTTNTIWNNTRDITIARESGGSINIGQTGSSVTGFTVNTTTGASAFSNGRSVLPPITFISEQSLGWYRSAVSTLALSYGTIDLTASGAMTSIASLQIKAGTNNSCGTAVLGSNGSVNVANTYVKTGDLIFLTDVSPAGTIGSLEMTGIRNSSGFTITSTNVLDTSTVAWLIIRPG